MKNVLFLSITIIAALFVFTDCSNTGVKARRVVLIGLDGISVEGYNAANHPNLDKLIAEGVLSLNTRNVMPSVTLPNWTSHLTGSGPEQHGVAGNGWELNSPKLPPVEKDSKGYYPSVFKILKDQVPDIKTAFYYNWAKLVEPYNQEYFDEASFEENDGYLKNYEKAYNFIVEK